MLNPNPIRLIKPVRAGPVMTEEEMQREWKDNVELVMTPTFDALHAADRFDQLADDADTTIDKLQSVVDVGYKQHSVYGHLE